MNETVTGIAQGNMVWLVIPFSVIISWMYTSFGQVGESTEILLKEMLMMCLFRKYLGVFYLVK
ncbi:MULTISPECIES: hypothetical protein [unclassified Flavobacterium]|uniref:hypothetical protein n=1 Tax=unclassified Flavobacterium TaxID=196869 RepID=UPI0006ABEAC4|nr:MULTISPECIES: hypothetical protein [unclassified Flavobacterium]KOP35974.1 hypothetical protein AKO67_22650 [Flavobacterium sp. VMW]OWU88901.1 hypothetical protein APR43_20930 [Flavobacterium sp. NLM]